MKYHFFLSVLLTFLSGTILSAQEKWTLEQCVKKAIDNSLEVKDSEYNLQTGSIGLRRAEHLQYPSLSANTGVNVGFGRSINPITNLFETRSVLSNSLGINTGVSVFNGFSIRNSIKSAKATVRALHLDIDQAQRDVALDVATAYLNALVADENYKIAIAQLQVSEDQLKQTQALIQAGARPANEALDVEAQLAANEQVVITRENEKVIALLNLKQLMMLSPSTDIDVMVPKNMEVLTNPDALTFDGVYQVAAQNEPSLKAQQLRKEAAAIDVKVEKGALYPSLGLGANASTNYARISDGFPNDTYGNQLDQNFNYGIGAQLSIPIYDNYRVAQRIQNAEVDVLRAQNAEDVLTNRLTIAIQQAITDAQLAKKQLSAADKSVAAQRASFDNAERRYEQGAINSFEYVTIQNSLAEAQVNAVLAKYRYIFAVKVLDFYMGKPITLEN